MQPIATNDFVIIVRDETEKERGGLLIPDSERHKVKPHSGTIFSVGDMVQSQSVKRGKGKKCLFHPTVGWEIDWEGVTYLYLRGAEIISFV